MLCFATAGNTGIACPNCGMRLLVLQSRPLRHLPVCPILDPQTVDSRKLPGVGRYEDDIEFEGVTANKRVERSDRRAALGKRRTHAAVSHGGTIVETRNFISSKSFDTKRATFSRA